ncbi:MAG TPA: hypothetical protein G4O18_01335 [Dehalococcoidia bacterium]|nr:hypothetical protein [Dehalococcoidia bacterium]
MKVREKSAPAKTPKATTLEYTHLPLGKDVPAFAGYYMPEKEVRIPFHGREILYIIGQVVVETACQEMTCTPGSSYYAMVPGYILKWQYRKNEEGLPVSEMEAITDFKTRKEIEHLIQERESVTRVEFR